MITIRKQECSYKKQIENENVVVRLKFCETCQGFKYHKSYLEFPARIYICQGCQTEERILTSFI